MILKNVDTVFKKIEKFFSAVSWIVALLVSALIVVDVVLRAVFDKPLPATWEISELLMPLIVFLPFAYTLAIDAHVKVTLFRDRMPPKVQLASDIFANAISFIICAMITYWSALRFWESFAMSEEMLAAIRLPWWVGKCAMPVGFGLFAIRYLILLFYDLSGQEYTIEAPTDAEKFVT